MLHNYMYLTCYERELTEPTYFMTLGAARREMERDFLQTVDENKLTDHTLERDDNGFLKPITSDDFELGETHAWVNDCGISHGNWDAKIIPVHSNKDTAQKHEDNVYNARFKTCIFMECTDFDKLLNHLYRGSNVTTEYSLDGMSVEINGSDIDEEDLHKRIAEYYGINSVQSIHTDSHDPVGVWIVCDNAT